MKIVPRNPKYRKTKWKVPYAGYVYMDLIQVQPMEIPTAFVYYLDAVYKDKELEI